MCMQAKKIFHKSVPQALMCWSIQRTMLTNRSESASVSDSGCDDLGYTYILPSVESELKYEASGIWADFKGFKVESNE